jgi:hypothetical protein
MTKLIVMTGLICWAAAGPMRAQTFEAGISGSYQRFKNVELGSFSAEQPRADDTRITGKNGIGARFTLNTKGYYGHEFGYSIGRADLSATVRNVVDKITVTEVRTDRIRTRQGTYNFLMYMMPNGERFRPFITVGLLLFDFGRPSLGDVSTVSHRTYGGNYGGGLKVKVAPHVLLRVDFRHNIIGKPYDLKYPDQRLGGGIYQQMEGSAGFAITF